MKSLLQILRMKQCAGGCLTGLIWVDLIIAKEMNSKFGKAIKVIKDVKKCD